MRSSKVFNDDTPSPGGAVASTVPEPEPVITCRGPANRVVFTCAWTLVTYLFADDHPGTGVLDLGARVSPDGEFTWTAGGVQIRSDGLHLTPSGVQEWIAPWLLPQLQALVTK